MKDENKIEDGGPAFPHGPLGDTIHGEDGREWHQIPACGGMSLRDWFAGQALIGIVSSYDQREAHRWARTAYSIADEMIYHRTK